MAKRSRQKAYDELAYYTLAHPDPSFIHQHVVDAFTAQHADQQTKPISVAFALVGLCLCVEKSFTGKQVQQAHMQWAKKRKSWPDFTPPDQRGHITVFDVVAASPGQERDDMIRQWCRSVWQAWHENQQQIRNLVKTELGIE
jgi:hypothetical protein